MSLLPYLEWVSYADLRARFWKIVTTHRTDSPLRSILWQLNESKLVEKKYDGAPPAINQKIKLTPYLYVRRISRSCPRSPYTKAKQKLDGTYGLRAARERARKAAAPKKKKPKRTVKTLTMDDVRYIQCNTASMSDRELAEMFCIHNTDAREIRLGKLPAHLKGQPAPSSAADIPAGISRTPFQL